MIQKLKPSLCRVHIKINEFFTLVVEVKESLAKQQKESDKAALRKRVEEIEKSISTLRQRESFLKSELPPRPLPQPESVKVSEPFPLFANNSRTLQDHSKDQSPQRKYTTLTLLLLQKNAHFTLKKRRNQAKLNALSFFGTTKPNTKTNSH